MASYTMQPQGVYAMPGFPVQGTMVAAPQQMAMGAVGAPSLGPRFQTSETECCAEPGGCGRCCYGYCCTACAFGDVAGSLPPGSACCAGNKCGATVAYASVGGIFYAAGVLFFGAGALAMAPVVSLFTSPIHWGVRKALKAQHGIAHEGCCPDFACVALCDPCVLCQELREIELRTAPPTMVVMSPMHQPGIMMMNMQQPQPVMAQPMMAQPMMAQPMMAQPQVVLAPQPMYK